MSAMLRCAQRTLRLQSLRTRCLHVESSSIVGMRRETKNRWERRAPLTPGHIRTLRRRGVRVLVQPSTMRIFTDEQYIKAGAEVTEDLSPASVILGVKEVPIDQIMPDRTYLCFSHTIKAQPGNMTMLDTFLERNTRLIDYECMVNEKGKRVVGFGLFAGTAGMIDLLRGLGDRMLGLGYTNPFLGLGYSDYYHSVSAAKTAVQLVGSNIQINGVPRDLAPAIFGFTGRGNVTKGALDIFQQLPIEMVSPADLEDVIASGERKMLFGVQLDRGDLVEHREGKAFDDAHYLANPHEYQNRFQRDIAPHLTALVNGMYWDARFPRLLSDEEMKELHQSGRSRLLAIADISADPYGSIQFTRECTQIDRPFLVHNPVTGEQVFDWEAEGILLGSVDNLPAELPAEASQLFGDNLLPYVPILAKSNGQLPYDQQADDMGPVLHQATITSHGKLTPRFEYIATLRQENESGTSTSHEASSEAIASTSKPSASAAGGARRGQGRQRVLLLGSGLVAGSYVEQLARLCGDSAGLTVAGADIAASEALAKTFPGARAVALELPPGSDTVEAGANDENLRALVADHDVVVSLLPAVFHPAVGGACVAEGKHMVSSSYISPGLASLEDAAREGGLTMLHECGLDPGIDHFMAVDLFQRARDSGRTVTGFESWCGGLPAPYCAGPDVLGYKFSWSPRGVLVASQASARYREHGDIVDVASGSLIHAARPVRIGTMALQGTPNRDSVAYEDIYGIGGDKLEIMLRGTLRYDGFWQAMAKLQAVGLLSAEPWRTPLAEGASLRELVQAAAQQAGAQVGEAELRDAEEVLASCAPRGLSGAPRVPAAVSPMDCLARYLEQGLMYGAGEVDMVALTHRVTLDDGSVHMAELVCFGQPGGTTAMAHTVGAPAALATQYVMEGAVAPGVHRPMDVELSRRFLRDLESKMSIAFREY